MAEFGNYPQSAHPGEPFKGERAFMAVYSEDYDRLKAIAERAGLSMEDALKRILDPDTSFYCGAIDKFVKIDVGFIFEDYKKKADDHA